MTDMTERKFYNDLDDAAADWTPVTDAHAPCFDEWNALRLSQGQRTGTFTEYMREIAPLLADEMNQSWSTLYHFVESVDGERPGEFPGGPVATPPAA